MILKNSLAASRSRTAQNTTIRIFYDRNKIKGNPMNATKNCIVCGIFNQIRIEVNPISKTVYDD